jgi:hypothetical protein
MQTKNITIDQIQVDDWFFLGGRLYRVVNVTKNASRPRPSVVIDFHNPHWGSSYLHVLEMDAGFPMQILNQ